MLSAALSTLTSPVFGLRKQVSVFHAVESTGSGAQHRITYPDTADSTSVSVIIVSPEQTGMGISQKDFGPINAGTSLLIAKASQGFLDRDKIVETAVGSTAVAEGSRPAWTITRITAFDDVIWARLEARAKE